MNRLRKSLPTLAILSLVILDPSPTQALDGIHYELTLRPDFESHELTGKARIDLASTAEGAEILKILAPNLTIRDAKIGGQPTSFEKKSDGWHLPLSQAQAKASSLVVEIDYLAPEAPGLVFGTDYVYTAFHVCRWLPCAGHDLSRATISLDLELPKGYRSVASGQELEASPAGLHRWQQLEPYPLYTLGFAAGLFTEVQENVGQEKLRYLGAGQKVADLKKKFADSARMLTFFKEKAGLPLPHGIYTQVLVPGSVAQEASSFSLIGTKMLDPILDDPKEDWVIAHEMAHQWWGNWVTCSDWNELWLNEGLTVFMTAAWKQHRWGEAAYQRELRLAKKSWQKAKDEGFDKPLSWPGRYPSLRIKRSIHYSKAAIFFDALRQDLGEAVFWNGLRAYTRQHAGQSVQARDLQRAMESSAGRSLQQLFDTWVF